MTIIKFIKHIVKNQDLIPTPLAVTQLAYFCAEFQHNVPLEDLILRLDGVVDTQFFSEKYSERRSTILSPTEKAIAKQYNKFHKLYNQFKEREIAKRKSRPCSQTTQSPKKKRGKQMNTNRSVSSLAHDKRVKQINSSATCFVNGMLVTAQSYSDIYNELNNR